MAGHFKKANVAPKRHLAEFKNFEGEHKLGDVLNVEFFSDADFVDVVGTSKGKGFQGVVKRHGFGGVGVFTTSPNAGTVNPVPSRFVVPPISGPRIPRAKPCKLSADGNRIDFRGLKPP